MNRYVLRTYFVCRVNVNTMVSLADAKVVSVQQ